MQTTTTDQPPRFLRFPEVHKRTGISRSHIHRMIAAGKFPRQIRLSHKVAVWREDEINAWVRDIFAEAA